MGVISRKARTAERSASPWRTVAVNRANLGLFLCEEARGPRGSTVEVASSAFGPVGVCLSVRKLARTGIEPATLALLARLAWFHGVMVSTLDSESSDPSSNLGGTFGFVQPLRCWDRHPVE